MQCRALTATAALLVLQAGCGSDAGTNASTSESEVAPAREVKPPGSAGARDALVISPRTYTSGDAKVKVTGFFQVDGQSVLNKPASITDEDQTWIQYGASGAQELNLLFTNSTAQAENGLIIGVGSFTVTAMSTSGECRTKFDVTVEAVIGHYSCTGSTGYDKKSGQMGKVDIEVEFSASSRDGRTG